MPLAGTWATQSLKSQEADGVCSKADITSMTFMAGGSSCRARLSPRTTAFTIDARVVDGAVNGAGAVVRWFGERLRVVQTGKVRSYGAGILGGAVGLVIWLLIEGGVIL